MRTYMFVIISYVFQTAYAYYVRAYCYFKISLPFDNYAGSSDDDSGNGVPIIGAAVGGVVAVLITALLFSIVFLYFYRHKKYKEEGKAGNLYTLILYDMYYSYVCVLNCDLM